MSNYVIEQGNFKLHLSDIFTVGFEQNWQIISSVFNI